jgi:hypothetical protein
MSSLNIQLLNWLRTEFQAVSSSPTAFCTAEGCFTRPKTLTFERCLMFLLNSPHRSLGVELVEFFDSCGSLDKLCSVSAWVQARQKISPEVFIHLNRALCQAYKGWQPANSKKVPEAFRSHCLRAVDGSTLYLPQTPKLAQYFGVQGNGKKDVAMARVVACHDVGTNLCYHSHLDRIDQGEEVPLPAWLAESSEEDIWIYDRGFPSYWLFWLHTQFPGNFVARMPSNFGCFDAFIASGKQEEQILLKPHKNVGKSFANAHMALPEQLPEIPIRLIRVELPSGEIEVLATSLLDTQQYPAAAFAKLYHLRWGVETFFDRLKNKLNLELFSGHLPIVIEQDFFASIFLANILEICLQAAQEHQASNHQPASTGKKPPESNCYEYKPNANVALGILKQRLVAILLREDPSIDFDQMINLMARFVIPIRPQRTNPRSRRTRRAKGRNQCEQNYKRAV